MAGVKRAIEAKLCGVGLMQKRVSTSEASVHSLPSLNHEKEPLLAKRGASKWRQHKNWLYSPETGSRWTDKPCFNEQRWQSGSRFLKYG